MAALGDHKIGAEEGELDQHHLGIIQLEEIFQMRDEDIVQNSDKSPRNKQDGDHRHRSLVRCDRSLGCGCCGFLAGHHLSRAMAGGRSFIQMFNASISRHEVPWGCMGRVSGALKSVVGNKALERVSTSGTEIDSSRLELG